jgi:hypothetical protein
MVQPQAEGNRGNGIRLGDAALPGARAASDVHIRVPWCETNAFDPAALGPGVDPEGVPLEAAHILLDAASACVVYQRSADPPALVSGAWTPSLVRDRGPAGANSVVVFRDSGMRLYQPDRIEGALVVKKRTTSMRNDVRQYAVTDRATGAEALVKIKVDPAS